MTIEERAAVAAEYRETGRLNCSQAVIRAFEDKLPVEPETLTQLTAGYGAGMGCMEATCGALIGAVMAAGVLTNGLSTPRCAKEILKKFREKCGATLCRDLKGRDTGIPLCSCAECVRSAVLALGEVLPLDDENP